MLEGSPRWGVAAAIALYLGMGGCAANGPARRPDTPAPTASAQPAAKPAQQIEIDGSQPREVQAAWLGYALGMSSAHTERAKSGQPPDPFAEEVAGLKLAVAIWSEQAQKTVQDPYLDQLTKVVADGFIDEYAIFFLSVPGWRISAEKLATLKLSEFAHYSQQNLLPQDVVRHAGVTFADRAPLLGDELTSRYPQFKISECNSVQDPLQLLITEWEARSGKESDRLFSSAKRAQFVQTLAQLQVAARSNPAAAKSILWVSPTVVDLYTSAGFCALEAKQARLAEGYWRRALTLNPAHANGWGELAYSLILQGRFDDALGQINQALSWIEDPCIRAVLLRKKGYVQIELRNFPAARDAYLRSLQLAPGNQIALSELAVIEQNLKQQGIPVTKDVAPEDGPARPGQPGYTVLSTCK